MMYKPNYTDWSSITSNNYLQKGQSIHENIFKPAKVFARSFQSVIKVLFRRSSFTIPAVAKWMQWSVAVSYLGKRRVDELRINKIDEWSRFTWFDILFSSTYVGHFMQPAYCGNVLSYSALFKYQTFYFKDTFIYMF